MIEALDTAIRLISIGATLLLLILLLAGRVRRRIKLALGGLLISAIAYLINSSPVITPPPEYHPYIDLGSIFTPFWTWLFGRRLFEDEPPPWMLRIAAGIMLASWFISDMLRWGDPLGFYAIHLLSLILVFDLLRIAIGQRDDDLVEKRRTIRLWLPLLVALQTGGVILLETILGQAIPFPSVQLVNACLIMALTLFAGLALLRTDDELLAEPALTEIEPRDPAELSASENVLREYLEHAMSAGYFRTPGLTITTLAEHLGTPEHRLRALINRRLGYRNFSGFLNHHRIAEARRILSDRTQVDLPVLTIAMDLGYNSLPTFNRAFKAETGTTPSDYRQDALSGNTGQN